MPGGHNTEKYKLVGCWVDHEFLAEIDRARGEKPRSLFVREALAEKLRTGYDVIIMREQIVSPDRAGKGGRKPQAVSYLKTRHKKLKEPTL